MTDKLAWLALRGITGVGPVLFHRLLQAFGNPAQIFQTPLAALQAVRGVSAALAQSIVGFRQWDRVEEHLSRLKAFGAEILTLDDPRYPERLQEIPYPPPLIFVKGEIKPEDSLALALVGTRAASYYGAKTSRSLARDLAHRGVTVVSGLARGIDTAAHQGALEGGGRTLAVLGCGLDVVYPPENREFYSRIPESGALVTEYPLGTPPEAHNFPRRNRLISGLALGVLVVEAGLKSGANITAQCALEQDREVMAVPGNVTSELSAGPNGLIRDGARPIATWEDVAEALPSPWRENLLARRDEKEENSGASLSREECRLLEELPVDAALPVDELAELTGFSVSSLLALLLGLELKGAVVQHPGKEFQRRM